LTHKWDRRWEACESTMAPLWMTLHYTQSCWLDCRHRLMTLTTSWGCVFGNQYRRGRKISFSLHGCRWQGEEVGGQPTSPHSGGTGTNSSSLCQPSLPLPGCGESTRENITKKLQDALSNISAASLKPQQRLYIASSHLLPSLYHQLTLWSTSDKYPKWLD